MFWFYAHGEHKKGGEGGGGGRRRKVGKIVQP